MQVGLRRVGWLGLAVAIVVTPSFAGDSRLEHFLREVKPLLERKCFQCHGEDKQEGGLRLDSRDGLLEGGDRGPAIVVGSPDESLLMRAVRYQEEDVAMPPDGRLDRDPVAALEKWIKDGAIWPEK